MTLSFALPTLASSVTYDDKTEQFVFETNSKDAPANETATLGDRVLLGTVQIGGEVKLTLTPGVPITSDRRSILPVVAASAVSLVCILGCAFFISRINRKDQTADQQ